MAGETILDQEIDNSIDSLFGEGGGSIKFDLDNLFSEDKPYQSQQSSSNPSNITCSRTATPSPVNSSITICHYKEEPQYGLGWKRDSFSLTPIWTVEPTIESIIETLKTRLGSNKTYHVEHLQDGPYNKFYLVSYEDGKFVIKVTLPICPKLKTESEVATLKWVYLNTGLPVPKVKCYDSSRDNPIGFEWILMDRIDGRPLSECFKQIPDGSLERIIKQIAQYTAKAFNKPFSVICNIYPPAPNTASEDPRPGELVCMPFFWGERGYLGYPRGPFRDTQEWNNSRLRFAYSDISMAMQFMRRDCDQKRDWEVGFRMLNLINRIRNLGHRHCPPSSQAGPGPEQQRKEKEYDDDGREMSVKEPPESMNTGKAPIPTMLWHDNLSLDNIFVDEEFVLAGILDWECVSCLPVRICQLPAFLQMRGTADTELPFTAPTEYSYIDDSFKLPGLTAFHRDLRQYTVSACRRIFLREMERIAPAWLEVYHSRADMQDFEAAVQHCDNKFAYGHVKNWVDIIERQGTGPPLHEQLYPD